MENTMKQFAVDLEDLPVEIKRHQYYVATKPVQFNIMLDAKYVNLIRYMSKTQRVPLVEIIRRLLDNVFEQCDDDPNIAKLRKLG